MYVVQVLYIEVIMMNFVLFTSDVFVMFVDPSYSFFEDGVTGTIQLTTAGLLREDALIIVAGGMDGELSSG